MLPWTTWSRRSSELVLTQTAGPGGYAPRVVDVSIEDVTSERVDSAHRGGRADAWVKVRQTAVIGRLRARRDESGT